MSSPDADRLREIAAAMRGWTRYQEAREVEEIADRIDAQPAGGGVPGALAQLLTFYRLEVAEQDYDCLSFETWENAVAAGCLVKVPGGFDPAKHGGENVETWGADPGDEWYEPSPEIVAALEQIPRPAAREERGEGER